VGFLASCAISLAEVRCCWSRLAFFAVGANERYVVAKQHPSGDRTITNYFIIDRQKDDIRSLESSVMGPMTEREFQTLATELALPSCSRVLAALE
jgi:hypothetical protein